MLWRTPSPALSRQLRAHHNYSTIETTKRYHHLTTLTLPTGNPNPQIAKTNP